MTAVPFLLTVSASTGKTFWYITRATGLVALVLLTGVMILGVVTSIGWSTRSWPRFITQGLHRNLSLLAMVVIILHVVSTVLDGFAPIGFVDALVPFHSPYRPLWLSLGTISFDLFLGVVITSGLRHRLGFRSWKFVHWSAYAMWPFAVFHGLGTGTDTTLPAIIVINVLCVLGVLWAIAWRLSQGWPKNSSTKILLGLSSLACVLAMAIFVNLGPMRPGWALRSGTPISILEKLAGVSSKQSPTQTQLASPPSTASQPAPTTSSTNPVSNLPTSPFRSPFSGQITQSGPYANGDVTISILGNLTASPGGQVQVQLTGPPSPGGGVSVVSSQVTYNGNSGSVIQLQGDRILAQVSGGPGTSLDLDMRLRINVQTESATGEVLGYPPGSGFGGSFDDN